MPERTLGRGCSSHAHRRDDAKIASAAAQRPEQLLFTIAVWRDHAPVRQHDFGGVEIVERQSEPADQRPVAAAERQSGHADGPDGAGRGRKPKRIRHSENVRRAYASRNLRAVARGDRHTSHAAQVEDDAVAQRPAGPVVASAAYRQRKIAIAGEPDGEPHVL